MAFITDLLAELKTEAEKLDGEARRKAVALASQLEAEVAEVKVELSDAKSELETEVTQLLAQYGPEVAELKTAIEQAVEDALASILSKLGGTGE